MKRPWFPFYVGDYVRDTARLNTEAHGAYLLLMMDYWVNGAPPDDDEILANITKLPIKIWIKHRRVLSGYFEVADGKWHHQRIEMEIAKAAEIGSSNSGKARGAAEKRWAKHRERKLEAYSEDAPSMNGAMLRDAQPQPHSHPSLREGEARSPDPCPFSLEFQPSSACREAVAAMGFSEQLFNREYSKFSAYYLARGTKRVDWNAALISWLQRASPSHVPVPYFAEKLTIEQAVEQWARFERWSRHAPCSEPGTPGCTAPPELLARYGLGPDGRKLPPLATHPP
jgi:uncharacterized protein YdaU (DUF1376 family)